MGRKHDRTAVVIQPKVVDQKPTPVSTMNFNSVMDQRGCVYVWKPKAMPPYSKHSIHYPPTSNVGDEDIPIHNTIEHKKYAHTLFWKKVSTDFALKKPAITRIISAGKDSTEMIVFISRAPVYS